MKQLDEGTLGYLAGIIDGEGSIGVYYVAQQRRYAAALTVVSTSKKMLNFLRETTRMGYIYVRKVREPYKPTWEWKVCDEAMSEMLKAALPFLVEKRQQAIYAIEFRRLINERGSSSKKLSVEERKERDALVKQIKQLKHIETR